MTSEHCNAFLKASILAETAASLLKDASAAIRSTVNIGICIGGTPRALNYWLCSTADDATRMTEWVRDHLTGANTFCPHGQPPYIVKAALCKKCLRDASCSS